MSTATYMFDNKCPKCGKPYVYVGDPVGNIYDTLCSCNRKSNVHNYGWVCPLCGIVNAPWVSQCQGVHYKYSSNNSDEWRSITFT